MSSQATGRKNPLLSYFAAVLLVWAMVASVEARYENGMINLGILALYVTIFCIKMDREGGTDEKYGRKSDPFNWPGGLAGGGILGLDSVEATSGYQYWAQLVNNSGGTAVAWEADGGCRGAGLHLLAALGDFWRFSLTPWQGLSDLWLTL